MPQFQNKNYLLILLGLIILVVLAGFFFWWQKPSNSTTQQPSNAITTPSDRAETFLISGSDTYPRFTKELKIRLECQALECQAGSNIIGRRLALDN